MINIEIFSQRSLSSDLIHHFFLLDRDFFPFPWKENAWRETFTKASLEQSPAEEYFLLSTNDKEAFVLVRLSYQEGLCHLLKILVSPKKRRQGKGSLLLLGLEEFLREKKISKIYLEVSVLNTSALAFYEKRGLQKLTRIEKFYSNGEAAFTLLKEYP